MGIYLIRATEVVEYEIPIQADTPEEALDAAESTLIDAGSSLRDTWVTAVTAREFELI